MSDRGKVIEIEIGKTITFNEEKYSRARIEIDHINYGLDIKEKKLNSKRRSNFTAYDICHFLWELEGMELVPGKQDKEFNFFVIEILCPIQGRDFTKKFRLVFTTSKNEKGIIGTITLYRVK
jgi:hypothetical protein